MRYISQFDNAVIYDGNGAVKHKFERGVLVVGDPTTGTGAGNFIDATTQTVAADTLQRVYTKDLAGNTNNFIEMVGQGALDGFDHTPAALSPKEKGYRGFFFEAPKVAAGSATYVVGQRWQVLSGGVVTYNNTGYTVNQVFMIVSGVTTVTTDSGYVALYLPQDLVNACEAFRDCEFKIKNLKVGDEVNGYWDWHTGYDARNENDPVDVDFIGWTRT